MTIAVLIPCYNEGTTVGAVVQGFKKHLGDVAIFVYDNNSVDDTIAAAEAAGAIVRKEGLQGKGNVVRRMFSDIEADVYVLVDGDDTYEPGSAAEMVALLSQESLDMVNGCRVTSGPAVYPMGHRLGNRILTGLVALIFGNRFKDMLSGYKVMSRRFVKSFPALTNEFEIETELVVHALELRMPVAEIETPYRERPPGSFSKLSTIRDGLKILRVILGLVKEERPLPFFSLIGTALILSAVLVALPLLPTYLETGLVPRFPTAILAVGMTLLGFLSFFSGLVLDNVTRGRRELKRLHYLSVSTGAVYRELR